ncbi:MAG: Asp-tRNA(Asn)/Glu-tRNA(Gln) amidotransferase subunit GatC [Rhodospirillaceae bacterium]|nr:Asp-tRNA(Asn)/Glu-tRNA(Gln) amidotransferase subunit GatC [Rhodospirillaceae bacterium]
MALDSADVKRIARLARIAVPDDELAPLANELNGILQWVEQLDAVDTKGIEPMTSVVAVSLPMREDAVADGGIQDKVLANAPEPAQGFYAVPKVVE